MALTWSDNGNLLSHGSTTYEWTFGNRLVRVLKPGSTTEYAYDSQDRRTVVIEDGVMTRTLWSGADEVGEYDLAGALKRRFIPDGSGSMDARLATVNSDNTIHWHHTDHQGSVIGTSNGSGQAVGLTNYSPHGEFGTAADGVTQLTAPPTGSPFGYTGRQWDAKAGLYQYRARYYDPVLGIFLSMDPIGSKDDPNLYGYVAQDPVNGTDPMGTCTINIGGSRGSSGMFGGCVIYGYVNSRGTPVPGANELGRASAIGRSANPQATVYDVAVVGASELHHRQIHNFVFHHAGSNSALRQAFADAYANPGQSISGVHATTVLPIDGSQGAGIGRTTTDWTGTLTYNAEAGRYFFDAVGVVRPQTFSTRNDGNSPGERVGIAVWAATMCQGCSDYPQVASADMLARFELQGRPVEGGRRRNRDNDQSH